jgi:hypothetical protein
VEKHLDFDERARVVVAEVNTGGRGIKSEEVLKRGALAGRDARGKESRKAVGEIHAVAGVKEWLRELTWAGTTFRTG